VARKSRDYKAEYKRRVARAARLGYSKAVARGHARKTEYGIEEAKRAKVKPGKSKIRATGREVSESTFEAAVNEAIQFGVNERKARKLDIHDEEGFIKALLDIGLTPREAYTLRFSP